MNNCNCKPTCGCDTPKCGCPKPIFDIDEMPNDVATLRFNFDGISAWYDFSNMIRQTQTDTTVSVDAIARVLKHMAERHTDTISAKELGSILHLADIGDVDITDVQDHSILVYKKDGSCASGCNGISNSWYGWNADEHTNTSMSSVMGFDANGSPVSLQKPAHTNQYYQLGWNASDKLSYTQPKQVTTAPIDSEGYKYRLYLDPTTKQIVYVKEK